MNLNVNNIKGDRLWFKDGVIDNLSVCKLNGRNPGDLSSLSTIPKVCFTSTNKTLCKNCYYVIINSIEANSTTVSLPSSGYSFKIKNITALPIRLEGNFQFDKYITININSIVEVVYDKDCKCWITF